MSPEQRLDPRLGWIARDFQPNLGSHICRCGQQREQVQAIDACEADESGGVSVDPASKLSLPGGYIRP